MKLRCYRSCTHACQRDDRGSAGAVIAPGASWSIRMACGEKHTLTLMHGYYVNMVTQTRSSDCLITMSGLTQRRGRATWTGKGFI